MSIKVHIQIKVNPNLKFQNLFIFVEFKIFYIKFEFRFVYLPLFKFIKKNLNFQIYILDKKKIFKKFKF